MQHAHRMISAVLELEPVDACRVNGHCMRTMHGSFMANLDADLRSRLHDTGAGPQPFTVSLLMRGDGAVAADGRWAPGDPARWRLTGLTGELCTAIEQLAARPVLREKLEAAVRAGAPAAQPSESRPPTAPGATAAGADPLLAVLRQFVEAETWLDSYRFVSQHPVLLTDAAEARLAGLAARAAAVEDAAVAELFAEHLALLRRAREVGEVEAFAEKLGAEVEGLANWAESGDAAHDALAN